MEIPGIATPIYDPKAQVRYVVMAYRPLSTEEAVQMIRVWRGQARKKDLPKRGEEITIVTVIGADE